MSALPIMDKRAEAEALQALAREGTRQSRAELARSVVHLFDKPDLSMITRERTIAYDILHTLILDVEVAIRRDISIVLARQSDAPHALIQALAHDEIDVAFPVLVQSGVLDDADLVGVIRTHGLDHWQAIAARPNIGIQVSARLAETNSEQTILALLHNKSAAISEKTMEHLVDRSREVAAYRQPILDRDDLGPALAMRMFFWVSTVLRDHIVEKFGLDAEIVENMIGQVVADEIRRVAEDKRPHHAVSVELKTLMKREGRLTADMLMIALREGEVPLFVSMFSRMTELDEHLVGRMLFEHDGKGLAIACRSADIGRVAFTGIFALAQKMRAADSSDIHRQVPAVLQFYQSFPRAAAEDVLNHWRRGADYAGAIRTVEHRLRKLGR